MKFSMIKRRFIITKMSHVSNCSDASRDDGREFVLRTRTIRFLKPKKLGATSESWLKTDALGFEWYAATCLYFLSIVFESLEGGNEPLDCCDFGGELSIAVLGSTPGACTLVEVAVCTELAILLVWEEGGGVNGSGVTVLAAFCPVIKGITNGVSALDHKHSLIIACSSCSDRR